MQCTSYLSLLHTYTPYVPEKNYNQTFRINNFQSIISGYETITYYLHFAENPIRFGQIATQKY